MELELWIEKHNIKEKVLEDMKNYLESYKEEEKEDYDEIFGNMNFTNIRYIFHSVAYVINEWHRIDKYIYISAKIRLEYDEFTFAEYEGIYDLKGELEDDYFRVF